MPLLLSGLELDDPKLRLDVITILLTTAENNDQVVVVEHSSTLISAMLKNSLRNAFSTPVSIVLRFISIGLVLTVISASSQSSLEVPWSATENSAI